MLHLFIFYNMTRIITVDVLCWEKGQVNILFITIHKDEQESSQAHWVKIIISSWLESLSLQWLVF